MKYKNLTYRLIIFASFPNDANAVSYCKERILDAILLDRITNPENEFYRNFYMGYDAINIKKIELDLFDYDNDWNIIGQKEIPDTIANKVVYKITKERRFEKINKEY